MRLIIVLGVLFFASHIQADVYKWVDENGRVHYSANPPANVESKKLGRPTETTEEETPEEQQARLEAIMKEAGLQPSVIVVPVEQPTNQTTTQESSAIPPGLDCEKSVVNARDGVDTMLSSISSSDPGYEKATAEIRKAKARISKTECKAATGDVKGFYECMMDDLNNIASCAEKHKYWDASLFPKKY